MLSNATSMSFDVVAKSKVLSGINFLLSECELLLCLINALYHEKGKLNFLSENDSIPKVSLFFFHFQNELCFIL